MKNKKHDIHEREGKAVELSSDKKNAILKSRAIDLARNLNDDKPEVSQIEILEFLLAEEVYGVETLFVREVCLLKELVHIPGTPAFVRGITNVRGEILSVIDIKIFFGLSEIELTNQNRVIIVNGKEMEFGILASSVSGVRSLPFGSLQLSLPTLTGIGADYLKGVTNERTVILNIEKILYDRKIVIDESIEA